MKKSLLASLFLLLATLPAQGADYLEDYVSIRKHVRHLLGSDTTSGTYATDAAMNAYIRQSIVDIPDVAQAIKAADTIVTTARDATYSLDSAVLGVRDVYWQKADSIKTMIRAPKHRWLELLTVERWSTRGDSSYEARPDFYTFDEDYLYLFPAPRFASDTIIVETWEKMVSVVADTTVSEIDQRYRTLIAYHSAYLAAAARGDARAAGFLSAYRSRLNTLLTIMGMPREATPSDN